MIHIFVDFEMNCIAKDLFEKIEKCHMEIIEIGAVAIDDSMAEIGSYKRYIKPQYNEHIMPRYVELTGINDKTVADADNFREVILDFVKWCKSLDGGEGYRIYSWSECDKDQLRRELKQKKIALNKFTDIRSMLNDWCDYQKEFSRLIGVGHPISLDKAVDLVGESFVGRMHDALCDARNTAGVFTAVHDTENFEHCIERIREILKKEEEEKAKNEQSETDNDAKE